MSIGLLGNKIGMTQIFDETGIIYPVTILRVGPCIITKLIERNKENRNSIQIGYKEIPYKKLTYPELGFFKKHKIKPLKYLKEFYVSKITKFKIGQILNIDLFSIGDYINVSGKNIGKGFSGLQKRYSFTKGPLTHGSKNHRAPGSIGMGTTPGRVFPGKKMSGHLGNKNTTIKNLKIIKMNLGENLLIIKGSVPGKSGNLLNITASK